MSRKRPLYEDEIVKELEALESSEDEDEIESFSFGDTNLSIDVNCALDSMQSIANEELLETLESPEVECGNRILDVQYASPSPQPHSLEPQTDVISIPEENEEYYREMFQVYSGLQNKVRQWSNKVENFREKDVFEKDLKSLITVSRATPINYFSKMFPDKLLELMVGNTNKYACYKKSKFWKDINKEELTAFLGIFILMGLNPLKDFELYWSSDRFYNNPEISCIMPLKRFKKILENFHVSDISKELPRDHPNYDKLGKLRPAISIVNQTFQTFAENSNHQSIDESMVKFKGRDVKKQYMPMKPIKRGYKVWCRCDSKTGYLYQFDIYTGKDKSGAPSEEGLGYKVVVKLTRNVPPGTLVIFDNFFTSIPLMEVLYERDIYCIGTVRLARKGMPEEYSPKKNTDNAELKAKKKELSKLSPGEFTFRYNSPVGCIKWHDTKDVHVLTTAVNPSEVSVIQRRQKNGTYKDLFCPTAIATYIQHMGGVDKLDHFRSSYPIGRKSRKTWLRLFWFIFETSIINAYILYCQDKERDNIHSDFRLRLARALINGYKERKQTIAKFVKKKNGLSVPEEIRLSRPGEHYGKKGSYRRCRHCSTRAKEVRTYFECKICEVPLCFIPCWEEFHKMN